MKQNQSADPREKIREEKKISSCTKCYIEMDIFKHQKRETRDTVSTMLRQIKSKKSEEKGKAERELVSLSKAFKKMVITQKKGTSSRIQWA